MKQDLNYHRINEARKIDRRFSGLTGEPEDQSIKDDSKTFNIAVKTNEGEVIGIDTTNHRKRLKEDREKYNKENIIKIDEEAIKEEMGEVFTQIEKLQKKLDDVDDLRTILVLKIRLFPNEQNFKVLLNKLQTERKEILFTFTTLKLSNPTIYRAYKLISYKQGLVTEGGIAEVPSVERYLEELEDKMIQGSPVLLHGPTGTGKTSIARRSAINLTGQRPYIVACHPDKKQSEIYGKDVIAVKEGMPISEYLYGPLTKAMTEGRAIIFDEFTALPKESFVFLKTILSAKSGDNIDIPGNGYITVKQGFQLLFTANLKSDKNPERQDLPPEMANEFGQNNIYIGYQSSEESYDIMLARLQNPDGSIDLSEYDLTTTLPQLAKAIDAIQRAYNEPLSSTEATSLGQTFTAGNPPN